MIISPKSCGLRLASRQTAVLLTSPRPKAPTTPYDKAIIPRERAEVNTLSESRIRVTPLGKGDGATDALFTPP